MPTFDDSANSDQNFDTLPDGFWQGVEQFNQGHYYDCHDTLEALWMIAPQVQKPFYQGILQISVGLYHLRNRNWRGAAILLGEGNNRLQAYEPEYGGINVSLLVDQAYEWLEALQLQGPQNVEVLAVLLDGTSVSNELIDVKTAQSSNLEATASKSNGLQTGSPKPPKIERAEQSAMEEAEQSP